MDYVTPLFQPFYTFFLLFLISHIGHGATVNYTFTVAYKDGYPDGVHSDYILAINGQFPGPTIEANVGDTLEVTVINNIQDGQNVTLHWHGIDQVGSVTEDGVGMITQCPIPVGGRQLYVFKVPHAGTFWYHSHVSSQYTEGLYGPLLVHGSPEAYDYYGEATLILGDWYHQSAQENEHWFLSKEAVGQPPMPDSVLMNGMGRFPCPYAWLQNKTCRSRKQLAPVVRIERGKTYRIRVINAGAKSNFEFSIAGHQIDAIEADGIDSAKRVTVDSAYIAAGQRYSFLVKCAEGEGVKDRFRIRATADGLEVLSFPIENINKYPASFLPNMTGILECTNDDLSEFPGKAQLKTELSSYISGDIYTVDESFPGPNKLDENDLAPGQPAPDGFDQEFIIETTFLETEDEDVRMANINNTSLTYPTDKPLLNKLILREEIINDMIRLDVDDSTKTVQIVINNDFFGPHPMHLHGHHFWVMGMGKSGDRRYKPERDSLTRFGVKRDTVLVPNKSWAVIRFVADNPGVWLFHCHNDWHAISGMGVVITEGIEELRNSTIIDENYGQACPSGGLAQKFSIIRK